MYLAANRDMHMHQAQSSQREVDKSRETEWLLQKQSSEMSDEITNLRSTASEKSARCDEVMIEKAEVKVKLDMDITTQMKMIDEIDNYISNVKCKIFRKPSKSSMVLQNIKFMIEQNIKACI